jgi:hypothetical protein
MNRAASLTLLASLACAADLQLRVEMRRGDLSVTLDRYSVAALAAVQARSLDRGEIDYTAKTSLRGEGVVIVWGAPPSVVAAVYVATVRRGSVTIAASELCPAPVHIGGRAQCYIQTGPFDAVTDLKAYPAVMSRVPVEIQ